MTNTSFDYMDMIMCMRRNKQCAVINLLDQKNILLIADSIFNLRWYLHFDPIELRHLFHTASNCSLLAIRWPSVFLRSSLILSRTFLSNIGLPSRPDNVMMLNVR